MPTRLKTIFLLFFFLFLCRKVESQTTPVHAFKSGSVDSISIRHIHPVRGIYRAYWKDRIYFLNDLNSSLDYFDLTKGTHETVVPVGEKLMDECLGFGVFHPDTITFLTFSGIRSFTTNGNLAEEHLFKKPISVTEVVNNEKLPLIRLEGTYIFPRMSRNWQMVYQYNPVDGKSSFLPVKIKEIKKRRIGVLFGLSMSNNQKLLAMIFQFGPELHLLELNAKTERKIRVQTPYYTPLWEMESKWIENEFWKHSITNGFFSALTFDSYHNKWVAAYAHPQPYLNSEGKPNQVYYRPFSVIVMNEKFEVENEFILDSETSWVPYFTVTERGLWLRKTNFSTQEENPRTEFYLLRY